MKRLLRGIIDFGSVPQERLAEHFARLQDAKIQWVQPADEKIFQFVKDFFESELAFPSAIMLADYFLRSEDHEAVERLKDIKSVPNCEGANYSYVLKSIRDDQATARLRGLLKETNEIAGKGKVIGEGRAAKTLQGLGDAIRHIQDADLYALLGDTVTRPIVRTELREATHKSWHDYQLAKANPNEAFGLLSGFEPLDAVCRGLRRGEIWIHAAYTGEMKSTLAQAVSYNAMTRYRRNVVYVSLEMTIEQFRRSVHALHSTHPRFPGDGVDYRRTRDGQLTESEEALYQDTLADFRENEGYARFETITVTEPLTIQALRQELERIHRDMEIGLLVVDHSELLVPPSKDRDHGVRMNSIYHALRDISLQFDGGKGLPLMVLHQVNRQGRDRATKENGRYSSMSALSWAHEAERTASLITWSYLDEALRSVAKLRLGCLKNRDNPHFEDFEANIDWPTKRLSLPSAETSARALELTENLNAVLDGI